MSDLLMNILGGGIEPPSNLKANGSPISNAKESTQFEFSSLIGEFLAVNGLSRPAVVRPDLGACEPMGNQSATDSADQTSGLPGNVEPTAGGKPEGSALVLIDVSSNQVNEIDTLPVPPKSEELLGINPEQPARPMAVVDSTRVMVDPQLMQLTDGANEAILDPAAPTTVITNVRDAEQTELPEGIIEIPVELIPIDGDLQTGTLHSNSPADDTTSELKSLTARIQIPQQDHADDLSELTEQPVVEAALRIDSDGRQLSVPVTLVNTEAVIQPTLIAVDDTHFAIRCDVRNLTQQSESDTIRRESLPDAQIVVRQTVLIETPGETVKQLLNEIVGSTEAESEIAIDQASVRIGGDKSQRQSFDTNLAATTEEEPQSSDGLTKYAPTRIGPVRLLQSQEQSRGGLVSASSKTDDNAQPKSEDGSPDQMLSLRTGVARVQIDANNRVTINRAPAASEPVQFKVELPVSAGKIAEVSSFKVSLKPESLGTVKVDLVVVNDHLAAKMSVESEAAKQAIESNLGALKEALNQQGVKVEQFSVDVSGHDASRGQYGNRRPAMGRRSKGETFSLDPESVAIAAPAAARSTLSANLAGSLNVLA